MKDALTIEDQAAQAVHIADGLWELPSSSCPGELRTYNANTGFCDCPGHRLSNPGACRHGQAVRIHQAADAEQRPVVEPLAVTLGRSIDFLRAKAECALAADLEADPDVAPLQRPCPQCVDSRRTWEDRSPDLCAEHREAAAEFRREDGEYVRRLLAQNCPTGMIPEGEAIWERYRGTVAALAARKIREVAA